MTAIKDYLNLLKTYPRFLIFGMLHMFFSSPGQSFVVAIFVPSFVASFNLGASGFGLLYSAATLTSACLLPFFGPLVDRYNLRIYSLCVGSLMLIAALVTASATALPILFIGILILRFSGQGLMTQIASVSITRFFGPQRGKALAIIGLGIALGTATLPVTIAYLIAAFGWRITMLMMAASVLVIFLPASFSLLKNTDTFQHPQIPEEVAETADNKIWSRAEVLKTRFFYFALPQALLIPFVSTGLMIHLGSLVEYKGWTLTWVAGCFVVSSIAGRLGSFLMGPIVDRITARKVFPYILLPYICGLVVLLVGKHPLIAPVWLLFSGLSVGFMIVTMSVLWAETFGVLSLGAISSMVAAVGVFASAMSPFLFGYILDHGFSIDAIISGGIVLTVISTAIAFMTPKTAE